jgi:hypothetical protein
MSETEENAGQRDRSPGYPIIPLGDALQRLVEFENHFKRSAARPEKIKDAWGIKAPAYAGRIAAALRYFGFLDYQGQGNARTVVVSDDGRTYLRAQQEEVKREAIKAAALRPKQIAKWWVEWGLDRPADAACLDDLVLKNGFSEQGARDFLKVYDATISFAKLAQTDITPPANFSGHTEDEDEDSAPYADQPPAGRQKGRIKVMEGERELTAGLLSKDANFRLIVSGQIGVKEIERLIAKLEIDKEILAEADEPSEPWSA